ARGSLVPERPEGARAPCRQRRDRDRIAARAVPVDDGVAAGLRRRGRRLRPPDRRPPGERQDRRALRERRVRQRAPRRPRAGARQARGTDRRHAVVRATDPTVTGQVTQPKATGAGVFVIFALPTQAIQAFVAAARLGWRPVEYVTSVSIDPAVMQI